MRRLLITLQLILILLTTTFTFSVCAGSIEEKMFTPWFKTKNTGVSTVKFQQYNDLCGSCHFPYQPGLLPDVSWQEIINNMETHFGQSVKMSAVEARTMRRYLLDNSAGHVNDEISNNILQTLKYNPVPVRITETAFFADKHNQLANKLKHQNFSQCQRCHQDALLGLYNKQQIIIPD